MSFSVPRASRTTLAAIAGGAAIAVLAIWAAAISLTMQDRGDVLADARSELFGAQNAISAQIDRTFENAQTLASAIDLWLQQNQTVGPQRPLDDLASWILALQHNAETPSIVRLFAANGDMVPVGPFGTDGLNVADRDYMHALGTQPAGSIYIGNQIIGRDSRVPVIPFAMKVRPNALGITYAVISVQAKTLDDAFDGLLITAPGIVGIVRGDGVLLYRSPDVQGLVGKLQVDLDRLIDRSPQAPRRGIIEYRSGNVPQPVLVAYVRLAQLPLYGYASFRFADLSEKAELRSRPKLIVAGLATFAVIGCTLLLIRLISQRENEARRVAEALIAADQASAAKTQFLANISHELRTPLNAIIGFSELMSVQPFGPLAPRYQGYTADILASGRHLLSIVDQLLDMASIEARRESLKIEPIDLGAVAEDVAQMMTPSAGERRVTVTVGGPPDSVTINSDARCLRQILINLVSNAVRFCRSDGRVEISWARSEDGVLITVDDQGMGIAEADLPRVFDLFWQGEDAYARRHGGIGLGLPLTRTLITALGGTISVKSEKGVGSRFTVRLPAMTPA